jgi:iron(III) transport system permease protein
VIVGVGGMVGACLLGVPLAYFTARYVITGRNVIATLAVLALVSPPFIGAYSWVVVAGNNGWLTPVHEAAGHRVAHHLRHPRHHPGVQPEVLSPSST